MFMLLGIAAFVVILGLVLGSTGILYAGPGQFQWIMPLAGVFLVAVIASLTFAGINIRRMSTHLDDLLAAAHKLEAGDYSARVEERGPVEVRSLATAFNSMASRLQLNEDQRRAMLADVSHELRTPLTIIQGNVEGILDGMYPADEARLNSVLEETRILSRLVEDLRTLALAEAGSLQLRLEATDLRVLIDETVSAFLSQAGTAGVRIEKELAKEVPLLEIDPERIRQVFSNLLSNALRYTPREGVVKVGLAISENGSKKRALITVEDSGPGIMSADLSHVFDRFYKSSDSRGMGLGLSIAKYIVEAHGGVIQAESRPGQGTKISFSLPC
jgi:signal transduction histidine kinase